jgi:hypothetical protein
LREAVPKQAAVQLTMALPFVHPRGCPPPLLLLPHASISNIILSRFAAVYFVAMVNMPPHKFAVMFVVLISLLSGETAYGAPEYTSHLVASPHIYSRVVWQYNMNNRGDVPVLYYPLEGRGAAGFVDARGNVQLVAGLSSDGESNGVAINDRRQIVGLMQPPYAFSPIFRYTPGSGVELINSPPGSRSVISLAINNSGAVSGTALVAGTDFPIGFCDGCPNLNYISGYYFNSINNLHQIVGREYFTSEPFLFGADGTAKNISGLLGISLDGGDYTDPIKINDRGSILVLTSADQGHFKGWFHDGITGENISIPSPAGTCYDWNQPLGMNNSDVVVAYYFRSSASGCKRRSFIWDKVYGSRDLQPLIAPTTPSLSNAEILAINDWGQLLVQDPGNFFGYPPGDSASLYLLQPIPVSVPTSPSG